MASVPILVFLGLSVLDLGLMYATDRQTSDVRRTSSLNASALWGRGHNKLRCANTEFSDAKPSGHAPFYAKLLAAVVGSTGGLKTSLQS